MVRATLALLVSLGVTQGYQTDSAEACGVHLVARAPRASASVSKHPSSVLMVGSKDTPLKKRLGKATHRVNRVESLAAVSKTNYHVIIVKSDAYDAARKKFPKSLVVKKAFSSTDTVRSIESALERHYKRKGKSK